MDIRLAIVQHGDYREATRLLETGESETYAGMFDSVRMTEELVSGTTYRIISLDSPPYRESRGSGELIGFSAPRWRKGSQFGWSWRAIRATREFRPTHILLRTGGLIALPILRYAIARDLDVMVMMAGYLSRAGVRERLTNRLLADALNHPCVRLVGNHRQPAADSLVAAGVRPEKVLAYEFAIQIRPEDRPAKVRRAGDPVRLLFVGTINEGKGVGDVLDAAILLDQSGVAVELTICGDGPLMPTLRERAAALPAGRVVFRGRVTNAQVHEEMARSTFVCMASRRDSSEGMPIVVTEGLTSRTPLLCSDHPCLTDILADGQGLRYFPSGDAAALAALVRELADDPETYARLSEATQIAWGKVICPTLLQEPIMRWRASWEPPLASRNGPKATSMP